MLSKGYPDGDSLGFNPVLSRRRRWQDCCLRIVEKSVTDIRGLSKRGDGQGGYDERE